LPLCPAGHIIAEGSIIARSAASLPEWANIIPYSCPACLKPCI